MHKYVPCVLVSKYVSKKNTEVIHVQEFPQAAFFAVTAYQNDQVNNNCCCLILLMFVHYLLIRLHS